MSESNTVLLTIMAAGLLVPALSRADDEGKQDEDKQVVGRELGSVFAWRLGPESLEEACRSLDADGADARKKALKAWLEKNAALIKQLQGRGGPREPEVEQQRDAAGARGAGGVV